MPAEAACLLSVIGNGIRWVKTRGELAFGETVAILGPGAQGLATVIAACEAGAERIIVLGLRRDKLRLELAAAAGSQRKSGPCGFGPISDFVQFACFVVQLDRRGLGAPA